MIRDLINYLLQELEEEESIPEDLNNTLWEILISCLLSNTK